MKIIAIRGKNLASLEKEFEVDFTAEPLRSAGIFAITGSTGSGKSTLLDTLCLALFDASPRTNRASENVQIHDVGGKTINQRDSRNILRRGATEGYAEAEFVSLGGNIFRSRWSVRRARNKADGLLQNSEIRLYNLTRNYEEQGLKTELLNKISELIGLSFDQFTRSVLLAQGDFATFLKAKQTEKAELLEKLTGTDIYSRISVAIFEKAKNAEVEWNIVNERIKGIDLLPDEQISAFEIEKAAMKDELSTLKKDSESLKGQLKWIEDKERFTNEIKRAEIDLTSALREIKEASTRFGYISQIDSAQEIRDTFGLLKNIRKQLSEYKKNLLNAEKQSEENSKSLSEAQKMFSDYEKEQESLTEKQKEIAPQIIKARELDVQIKAANVNVEDSQKEFSVAKASFEKTEKNIAGIKNVILQNEKTCADLENWFVVNKNFENIAPRTELLINLASDAQTSSEQIEQNKKTLVLNDSILGKNIKQLDNLKQEAEKLKNLLPVEIASLRDKLIDGEPCPVCGSIHHPAAKTADLQRMKEQELKKAKDENAALTESLTVEIEKRKNEITRLSAMIENYVSQYEKAFRGLESNLSEVPLWKELFERDELNKFLKTKSQEWNNNSERLVKTREEKSKFASNLESEDSKHKEAYDNLTAKTERLSHFQKTSTQLISERAGILHGKPADAAEKYFIDQQVVITDKLKKASAGKDNFAAKHESLNGIISQIKTNITQSESKFEDLQKDVDHWIDAKKDISFEQLSEILEKDNTWIQTEKQALKALTDKETAIVATLEERRKNLDKHNTSETKPKNEEKDTIRNSLTKKNELTEIRNKRNTEIEVILTSNIKAKEQIAGLEKELKEKGTLAENWKKLNVLLGSATGNKFKEIAQGYTLETLLSYANKHLEELSPRYHLQRIPDTLALQVIDMDMLNESRTIHSLSGGESFLISLALALGLSSLSSNRMKVESLFIDEGFGSLDSDTLRMAMDALEHLQTQGRKIGVISHVVEMTERINAQIKVTKTSNGKSEIEVIG